MSYRAHISTKLKVLMSSLRMVDWTLCLNLIFLELYLKNAIFWDFWYIRKYTYLTISPALIELSAWNLRQIHRWTFLFWALDKLKATRPLKIRKKFEKPSRGRARDTPVTYFFENISGTSKATDLKLSAN